MSQWKSRYQASQALLPTPITLVAATVSLFGCASYDVHNIDVRPASQYASNDSASNITIAAEAYTNPDESQSILDEDVTSEGYVPVLLIVENRSDERILILRASVELEDLSGHTYRPVNSATVADSVEDNKMAYALLGFGILSYQSADDANKDREADYLQKSLPENLIIPPGRSEDGLVFFEVGRGIDISGYHVNVTAERMDSNSLVDLSVELQ